MDIRDAQDYKSLLEKSLPLTELEKKRLNEIIEKYRKK